MVCRFFILNVLFIGLICSISNTQAYSENGEDLEIYRNWIRIHQQTEADPNSSEPVWNFLAEEFFELYLQTGEVIYLNFAFSEAGRAKREEMIARPNLNLQNINLDYAARYIHRTEGNRRYELRDFGPDDIYLFLIHRIPPELEEEAARLLDHWYNQFQVLWDQDRFRASFIGQALLYGYFQASEFQKVTEIGTLLLEDHPFPVSLYTTDLFRNLANASRRIGYNRLTVRVYSEILIPISEDFFQRGKPSELADFLYLYGTSLYFLGEIDRAIEVYERVTNMLISEHEFSFEENLYNNLAVSYLNMGFFDRYIRYQLRSFDLASERQNVGMQIQVLSNLYNFHRNRNDFTEAGGYLNLALQIANRNNLLSESANLLILSGINMRENQGDPLAALDYFYRALEAAHSSENYRHQLNSLIQLGETYYEIGKPESGLLHFSEAIETTNFQQDPVYYLTAVAAFANTLTRYGDFNSADTLFNDLKLNDLTLLNQDAQAMASNSLVRLYLNQGDTHLAYETAFHFTQKVLDWLRESVEEQSGMIRLRREFSEAFHLYFTTASETDRIEEALITAGSIRNISRSGFYNSTVLKSSLLSDEELTRDNQLAAEIQQLRQRLRSSSADQRPYLNNELMLLLSERNELLNQRMPNRESFHYRELLQSIRSLLGRDEMIVYFVGFEETLFQFLISRKGIHLVTHEAEKIDRLLLDATERFGRGTSDLRILSQLYTRLFRDTIPASVKGLYIVPDGELYRLPVEILPVNEITSAHSFGSARYMIEEFRISYLNTLTDLILPTRDTGYNYSFAGFGVSNFSGTGHTHLSDLPFAREEVMQSAKAFEGRKELVTYIDEESTVERLFDIAEKSQLLHLATHSMVNEFDPLFSVLYLHPKESYPMDPEMEESFDSAESDLYAYQLFDLNLNSELIFLSSCESGSGGYLKGAGVLGLSRSLSYAGARRLILNLWPVRDQTSSFIAPLFYQNIMEGASKAEALRQAKIFYLNHHNSDPYLWGSFVLYGPPSDRVSGFTYGWLFLPLAIGFLMLLFYRIYAD